MKKLASTLLVTATLVGDGSAACAQYGGGYYGPGPYYGGRYYEDGRYYRRGYGYGGAIIGYAEIGRQQLNFPAWTRWSVPTALRGPKWALQTVSVSRRILLSGAVLCVQLARRDGIRGPHNLFLSPKPK